MPKLNVSIELGDNPDLSKPIEIQVPQIQTELPELKPIEQPILAIDQKKWRTVSSRFSYKTYTELHKVHTQDNIGGYAMSVIRFNNKFYHYFRDGSGKVYVHTSPDGINITPAEFTDNTGGVLHDVFYHEQSGWIWFVYIRDKNICLGASQNPLEFNHWITLDCEPEKLDTNHCIDITPDGFYIYGRKRGGWDSGDQDRRGFVIYHSKQAESGWSIIHVEDPAKYWHMSSKNRPDFYQPYFRGNIGQVATFHRQTDQVGETRPDRITGKLYPTLWYDGELIDMNRSLVPLNQFNNGDCQIYVGSMLQVNGLQVNNDWYCYFKYRYGVHYSDESNNPPDEHWLGIIRGNRFGSWQSGTVDYIGKMPYNFEDIQIEQTGTDPIKWQYHSTGVTFIIPDGSELISIQFLG
jgi:hypothetical protein